jgi:hypothetical protein
VGGEAARKRAREPATSRRVAMFLSSLPALSLLVGVYAFLDLFWWLRR